MVIALKEMESSPSDIRDEKTWNELYSTLRPSVKKLVRTRPLDSWYGQEDDVVDDIVQETMYRLLNRVLKAERKEMEPLKALKPMMYVIAKNYCKDLRRRDHRLLPFEQASDALDRLLNSMVNPADIATEEAHYSRLFKLIASEIAGFPLKQRKVLLTDIARYMAFEQPMSALEKAFLDAGISICTYRNFTPRDPQERNRHYALLSCAYKRLFQAKAIRQYILQLQDE